MRFILFSAAEGKRQPPFGITSGEVVVVPELQKIIRLTNFLEIKNGSYIYSVPYEYRDGIEYAGKPIYVGYEYAEDLVWEHYINEGWKLYSKMVCL